MDKKQFLFETLNLIILAASVYILLPEHMLSYPHNGLDPSWMIAINMAVKQHLMFGSEFIYTFGPLGFFYTGLPLYVPKSAIILFHLFIFGSLTFIIHYYLQQIKTIPLKVGFFVFLLFCYIELYPEKAFLLFLIFLFFVFFHLRHQKSFALFVAGFIALLAFFVKLNTGLLLSFLLAFYLLFLYYLKYCKLSFTFAYLATYLALLFIISAFLHVDVFSYIANGINIINYYNDAVMVPPPRLMFLAAVAIIAIYLMALFLNLKLILLDKKWLFIVLYISFAFFVLFKEGFVRADGHIMLFFGKILAIMSFLYFFTENIKARQQIFYGILLIGLITVFSDQYFFGIKNPVEKSLAKITKVVYRDILLDEYRKHQTAVMEDAKKNAMMPQRVLNKLNGKTVDIIPTDISYIYFNDLNYNPRPSIQSYASYSARLDSINAAKYASPSAPDYILFAPGSIDGRHPFWDETKTKLIMLGHYQVDDTLHISSAYTHMGANEDFVLLKKRDKKLALKELGSQTIHYQLGVTLQIPQSDHLIFLSADVRYTLIGKIMRLLFQPNRLTAELWYHNTEESSIHFAIKPILKGGVLINKKVITIDDARNFFLNHGKTNVGINRICIAPKYIFQLGFVEEIKLTFHEIMVEE